MNKIEEIKTINMQTLRLVLESYGVKKRHIRNLVTDSIFSKAWGQTSRFSPILEPNTVSIEKQIIERVILKRNVDITLVDDTIFGDDSVATQLHENLLKMLTFEVDITENDD